MAGYKGYSMSNNAVAAYDSGEMPKSKWTKKAILEQLKIDGISKEKIEQLNKVDAQTLKDKMLYRSSKHHTSNHYNFTEFFSVSTSAAEDFNFNGYEKPMPKKAEKPKEDTVYAVALEWSGTRKHPKATEVSYKGKIIGNWFYPEGTNAKKSINAKGFSIIDKKEFDQRSKKK
jgi:hypothetical protein